jgi:hypothetical protein
MLTKLFRALPTDHQAAVLLRRANAAIRDAPRDGRDGKGDAAEPGPANPLASIDLELCYYIELEGGKNIEELPSDGAWARVVSGGRPLRP